MSKIQSTATTAERKQALDACMNKLREINLTIGNLYPPSKPSLPFSKVQELASDYYKTSYTASLQLTEIIMFEARKEAAHG